MLMYILKLLYIFKLYQTVMPTLIFGTSQIIAILLNNLQPVDITQLC